ncbi:MAG TPA: hypothetical protein VFQ61_26065 [Polyangiaceae bacterium]|nr:hypothetical protein [Polyangiaceae bacterium]
MPDSLVRAALVSLAVQCACSTTQAGIEVEVWSEPLHRSTSEPLPRSASEPLSSNLGYTVRLEELLWSSSGLALKSCEAAVSRSLQRWFLGTAHAHGAASPTRLSTSSVESGLAENATWIGTLRPPADAYCGATYSFAPADSDALGLPRWPEMLGVTLYARGTYQAGRDEPRPFELATSASFNSALEGLTLDVRHEARQVTLRLVREPAALFDDLEFSDLESSSTAPDVLAHTLLRNLGTSTRAVIHEEE